MILLGFDVNAIPIRGVVKFSDQKSWRGEADSTCQRAADAEEFAGKWSTIRPVRVEPRIFVPVKCTSVLARIGFLDDSRLIFFRAVGDVWIWAIAWVGLCRWRYLYYIASMNRRDKADL